jgi:hypothetical protein
MSAVLFILAAACPTFVLAYNTQQAADVVTGQPDMTSNTANNGGVKANTLRYPKDVCSNGTWLFVTDSGNHRVLIYNSMPTSNGASASVVIGQPDMTSNTINNGGLNANTLFDPWGIFSYGTQLFVADCSNNRILIYNTIPTSNGASANVVIGQSNMTSNTANNGGLNANTLFGPTSIYSDGIRLFVADCSNSRILIYNTIPTSNGASANVVIGQSNMTSNGGNNGGLKANTLYLPKDVYSDGTRLFVADGYNNRILIYNTIPVTNGASANMVIGQPDMTSNVGNNGGLKANSLYYPECVYSNGTQLFVSDWNNSRVLIYNTMPTTNGASADKVLGQPDMTSNVGNNGGLNANTLRGPMGMYGDVTRLFVADNSNNRVLTYYPPQLASVSPSYGISGKTVQITVYGAGINPMVAPLLTLARSGNPNIANATAVQDNLFSYTYTLDLTQAAPNCYDVTVTSNANPRTLKQAFTVLSPYQAPVAWKINDLGQISAKTTLSNFCGLEIGDADQDNNQELYVANQDSSLYVVKKSTYGWSFTALPSMSGANFNQLLPIDGNGDQAWELYGTSANNHAYEFKTAAWQTTDLGAATGTGSLYGLAGLDADHDGIPEIYVSKENGHIFQIKRNGGSLNDITTASFPTSQGNALAAGDGNNDGTLELYSANSDYKLYQYVYNGTAWQVGALGTVTDVMYSVTVGDGDNDGQREVYGASKDGYVYQGRWNGASWTMQSIGHGNGAMYAVAVSDGENNGSNQVYAACGDGHVYEYKYAQGNWSTLDLGSAGIPLYALAVGDADNDYHFEVYALGQNNHVYEFKAESLQPVQTPTPVFTAPSVSPERFFKIYRNQVNPNRGESALVRWSQPQTAPVTITVYNLVGDKIITLVDHQTFSAGQFNEVTWKGVNSAGRTVGSGIYIVYFKTDGYETYGKAAVIK